MALAETLKHVEIEMIKGKAVITSVTKCFHICWLSVLQNQASMTVRATSQILDAVPHGFYANGRLLYPTGTNPFLFQTTRMLYSYLLYGTHSVGHITVTCILSTVL